MYIDLTLRVTPKMLADAGIQLGGDKGLAGHFGTHFDVMDKEFPLEYFSREAVVFDVRAAKGRDIELSDIDSTAVDKDMFVAFYSGFIDEAEYGTARYFQEHPQLSTELLDYLVEKKISIIGIDFAGVRRGKEHTPKDQYLAEHNIFVVENLFNLGSLPAAVRFKINTYPVNYSGMSGLPCRVVAEV